MPTPEAIVELSKTLRIVVVMFQDAAPAWRALDGSKDRFWQGLNIMRASINELLPHMRQAMDAQTGFWPDSLQDEVYAECQAFLDLGEAVYKLGNHPMVTLIPFHRTATPLVSWNQAAEVIAAKFRIAMASTNPGLKLRLSNTGPVVRFVASVIPDITGDSLTTDAVARHLQRRAKARG